MRVVRKKRFIARKFKRRVARALPQRLKTPGKWVMFRSTAIMSPSDGTVTAAGKWQVDIAHGHSSHVDGVVAMAETNRLNLSNAALPPSKNMIPHLPNSFVRVQKSFMVLFVTNNSATSVYGTINVAKPRKHINQPTMWPSGMAQQDISQASANDIMTDIGPGYLGTVATGVTINTYDQVLGLTDKVVVGGMGDIGYTYRNSATTRRYYKIKTRNLIWAPMECKKFTFKHRGFSVDCASEYTMQPATTASAAPRSYGHAYNFYSVPTDTGFAEMHARRGFFVCFDLHGVPARDNAGTSVSLTQPAMDMYWVNAYKYSWSVPSFREHHVTDNPLSGTTTKVAIPGFGSVPATPQLG